MEYKLISKKELPKCRIELEIEIGAKTVERARKDILRHMTEHTELPGFRKGKVPEDMIISRVGETAVWEDAVEKTLERLLPELFEAEKIDPVGRPDIVPLKLAPGNPVNLRLTFALVPALILPDYKKIAATEQKITVVEAEVTDKEISDVVAHIRKQAAPKGIDRKGEKTDIPLSDDEVKKFGDFKSVSEFTEKIRANLTEHKREQEKQKKRARLLDSIVKGAKGELPEALIDGEVNRMEHELKNEMERFGATMEQYRKETKKTIEEMRREWRPDAEKRARLQLTLNQIAEAEKISASPEAVEKEVAHLLEHHKDADPERARIYLEGVLRNDAVITFLESQK